MGNILRKMPPIAALVPLAATVVVVVVVLWVPEGFRGSQESKSACDSSTDGIRAWHGGALGPSPFV